MSAFEVGFFSIPVLDMDVAKSFYGKVMGWGFKDRDARFVYVFANGNMAGAIELATDTFRPSETGPLLFFRADFMSKALAKVTANGGTVIEKVAVDNGARGFTAKAQDPFKNTVGFWAPED